MPKVTQMSKPQYHQNIVVAVTGASGSSLALSFFENFPVAGFFLRHCPNLLVNERGEDESKVYHNLSIHVIISPSAQKVFNHEQREKSAFNSLKESIITAFNLNSWVDQALKYYSIRSQIIFHEYENVAAKIASGSFHTEGMVIIPASQGCVGRIANGMSSNLIERAADVCLKEKRPLILVPRESPLHQIHLQNLLTLSHFSQVSIIPAMIPYYIESPSLKDMNQFLVSRILQHLGVQPQKEFYEVQTP